MHARVRISQVSKSFCCCCQWKGWQGACVLATGRAKKLGAEVKRRIISLIQSYWRLFIITVTVTHHCSNNNDTQQSSSSAQHTV